MEQVTTPSEKRLLRRADIKRRWGIGEKLLDNFISRGILSPVIWTSDGMFFSLVSIEKIENRQRQPWELLD